MGRGCGWEREVGEGEGGAGGAGGVSWGEGACVSVGGGFV